MKEKDDNTHSTVKMRVRLSMKAMKVMMTPSDHSAGGDDDEDDGACARTQGWPASVWTICSVTDRPLTLFLPEL